MTNMLESEYIKNLNLPQSPGCYLFRDEKGKIVYIGKAANLASRVRSYWQKGANHAPAKSAMMREIASVSWMETDSEIEALLVEANLVKKHQPPFNVVLRDDKRFLYIKVSTEDEIPGVFATRKVDRAGKYFGPYTSATAVRETLKAIRKIWPYCTSRKAGRKACFYAQIGRCTGVCGGSYPLKDYRKKVVKPIIMFLEGKKDAIITNYELRIMNYEKEKKRLSGEDGRLAEIDARIRELKYALLNMRQVLAHTNIIGVGEKYAADVTELAKVLGLPQAPGRIEGYDISNIFGREAVGSMVVFAGGEPDKSQYRKFKIKIGEGEADDIRMLTEILERRFRRSFTREEGAKDDLAREGENDAGANRKSQIGNRKSESWPLPDLIIVDGGKAQLNAAVRILKKAGFDIPAIAVSKGAGLRSAMAPDKLFFPGEKKPLELPLASPALHIIKRVRDEAHRFAIGYHRQLRRKDLFFGGKR